MTTTKKREAILANEAVQKAIQTTAGADNSLSQTLADRADEALRQAESLAGQAKPRRRLSDEALIAIAYSAVREADPGKSVADVKSTLILFLEEEIVPEKLWLSWGPPPDIDEPAEARVPEITAERGAELTQMQNTAALMDQAVMDMAPVAEALGRVKAAEFFSRVSDIVVAQAFSELRNSKKYKDYPIQDKEGNLKRASNFEEFCQLAFGKTYRRCFDLAQNLHLLGPALYESAERVGFKARDYAALKALPAAEQEVVKQALASESKEQVLDILQDFAVARAAEREAAKKEAEELKADKDALDKLLKDKSEKLDGLTVKLEKLRSLPENKRQKLRLEQEEQAATKLAGAVIGVQAAANEFCRQLADIKGAEVSIYTQQHADATASWLCQQIQYALQENGIQADMAEIVLPEWMRETAKASPVAEAQA